jgi:hypothetical protein
MHMVRKILLILAACSSAPAAAAPPRLQSPAEALADDAGEYARRYSVSAEEAQRRLGAQAASVAAIDRLKEKHRRRLAGVSFEHRPDYRLVLLLTGRKRVREQTLTLGNMAVPVVFRTGATASRRKLLRALDKRGGAIRAAVPQARGMGIDPRTGGLVLMLRSDQADRMDLDRISAEVEEISGVPVRLRILERPETNLAVEGGARVEGIDTLSGRRAYCTSGFVVTDGSRAGIVTAAHCPDALTYVDPADGSRSELPFLGQWGWSFQDVQLNASEAAQAPVFFVDTGKTLARSVTGSRSRAATRAGDFLCHRGERSGYSCAEVELTDYAPPGDLCGGPCAPVWVTVGGPCGNGDSGGPVFSGGVAYGIVKGGTYTRTGSCAFYYYMSLDYLPKGWSLLQEPPAPPAVTPEGG